MNESGARWTENSLTSTVVSSEWTGVWWVVAAIAATLVLLAVWVWRKGRPFAGRTFWLYMLLYAISRYVIEYYRDDPRGTVGPFSTSQFMSLILAPLAVGMLVYLRRFSGGPAHQGARSQRAA